MRSHRRTRRRPRSPDANVPSPPAGEAARAACPRERPAPASVPTTRPRTERPALTNTYDALPRYAPISSLGGTFSPAEGSCPAASGPAWLCPPPRGASHKKVQRACAGLPLDVTPAASDAPLSTRVAGTGRFEQRRRTRTQHTHTHTHSGGLATRSDATQRSVSASVADSAASCARLSPSSRRVRHFPVPRLPGQYSMPAACLAAERRAPDSTPSKTNNIATPRVPVTPRARRNAL